MAEGNTSALEIFQVVRTLEERRSGLPDFDQTVDALRRASEEITVADIWEESLDESCLSHAREWKLEQDL